MMHPHFLNRLVGEAPLAYPLSLYAKIFLQKTWEAQRSQELSKEAED